MREKFIGGINGSEPKCASVSCSKRERMSSKKTLSPRNLAPASNKFSESNFYLFLFHFHSIDFALPCTKHLRD
jgi:hypothetical protein